MSKKSDFIVAYNNLPADTTRKDALAILSAQCGLSTAGASTYYANVKSGKWSIDTTAPVKVEKKVKSVVGIMASTEPESTTVVAGVKIVEQNGKTTVDGVSLDDLSGPELVAMFNSRVAEDRKVTKFRTKADGIKRIVNMMCE